MAACLLSKATQRRHKLPLLYMPLAVPSCKPESIWETEGAGRGCLVGAVYGCAGTPNEGGDHEDMLFTGSMGLLPSVA